MPESTRPSLLDELRRQSELVRAQQTAARPRNVDRFESVLLEFEPTGIDEPALEDLVRFMLGESNGFLRRAPLAHGNSRHA